MVIDAESCYNLLTTMIRYIKNFDSRQLNVGIWRLVFGMANHDLY